MLGRKDFGEVLLSSSSSSSSSPPETPTDPCLTRAAGFRNPRSARSESFKALLLRKGSRVEASSRISAVERLCVGQFPPPADPQKMPPPPLTSDPLDDGRSSSFLSVNAPPLSPCELSMMFGWRRRDLMLLTSSSPVLVFSSSHMRPRSLTPPCSSSRRFAGRCRLFAAPMTAILEGEDEEEDGEILVGRESNLSMVEAS